MTASLFDDHRPQTDGVVPLGTGAAVLRGFAHAQGEGLVALVQDIAAAAPFRHLVTPGGHTMSVAMTNCGSLGWISDPRGYRYSPVDPLTGEPWPAMPEAFMTLARSAAAELGFHDFVPDACLVNRYAPGARLSMHQDRNERRDTQPIVSVSLGVPAMFRFGGQGRDVKPLDVPLFHGDVVVWGGPSRMNYHGIAPLKDASHPLTEHYRFNLTFRTAR